MVSIYLLYEIDRVAFCQTKNELFYNYHARVPQGVGIQLLFAGTRVSFLDRQLQQQLE